MEFSPGNQQKQDEYPSLQPSQLLLAKAAGAAGSDLCPASAADHLIAGLSYVRAQIISSFCSEVLKSVDQ